MPDKQLSTISYAAGASLAAIALVYVFAPNFVLDESSSSSASRKKGVVGLRNSANDCFINATLQALAGLNDLRLYLIRETHRRNIEDPAVYARLVQPPNRTLPEWKLLALQQGAVTQGFKDILDALNERPIYKKSTSAADFIRVMEAAFRQRVSRQQQDAQEFLQIVAERLQDEYHAGERARAYARRATATASSPGVAHLGSAESQPVDGKAVQKKLHEHLSVSERSRSDSLADAASLPVSASISALNLTGSDSLPSTAATTATTTTAASTQTATATATDGATLAGIAADEEEEEGFPMEGQHESQLRCQSCGYRSKPKTETFVTLTLNVPHVTSTSLSACFDEIFKTEYIDDFKCEKCRLLHAEETLCRELAKAKSDHARAQAEENLQKLRHAIESDPENPPPDVPLPDAREAPKRRIARSFRITSFPKILTVHLSRSIFSTQASTKNSAKVAFPEHLPLGGLADRRKYRLLGLVTHKGSHNSGHYESFRRQNLAPAPYANSNTFRASGVYSKSASPVSTPQLNATSRADTPAASSTPDLLLAPSHSRLPNPHFPLDADADADASSIRSVAASTRSALSRISLSRDPDRRHGAGNGGSSTTDDAPGKPPPPPSTTSSPMVVPPAVKPHRKRKAPERWWRISDETIREAKTSEVLGMQREVYLLFYEMED
ncbi:cysteine proteinase [Sodiomyces alkalinus F11]|uniref:Ubiquitin carboxyl-terminal hydrolase n=1 Tax=Sodiomyces alkalinus (strain CBS 110278 / VKM F-3762 / F11) TaxID=1314773 RepID=A0A3N2PQH2_SODAK|nr:cysteine proteinase [Sodiomyces alkalinus F11]ROT36745.1 cysteine proteinase [Sodiomyces alkalinus F11]